MADQNDILRYQAPPRMKLYFGIAACVFLFILVFGVISRVVAAHRLAAATTAASIPVVSVITPSAPTQALSLTLPGTVKAYYEAPIYAQVSGYLQNWTADIGTKVKAGEVLATISTPNLDQQLAQAQANLNSAIANEQIAATTAERWNKMRVGDAVSQQDADVKEADYQAAAAATAAARATVAGYQAQEAFKRIVAPFGGVVTARNTDIGALITTGTPSQTPLFVVDDESRLRVYVSVPQAYAAEMKQISSASFTVSDYPGRVFTAKLTATADAIDPSSGTLLVQFLADNADGALQPGDYAQVKLAFPATDSGLSIPSSALMFRDNGMNIATIGPDNRVVLKPITISRDLGATVQIATGLSAGEKIINNPPDALEQGDKVEIALPRPKAS